jgi:sulfopyruvate decarboxylase TPP-binding subunit
VSFRRAVEAAEIDLVACVPDSRTSAAIDALEAEPMSGRSLVVRCPDEASLAGVLMGYGGLAGRRCLGVMESSGVRRAAEALGRGWLGHGLSVVLCVTDRGAIGDGEWWAQNQRQTLEPVLAALQISSVRCPASSELPDALSRAFRSASSRESSVAVLVPGLRP